MNWEVFSLDWSFSQLFYSKLVLPQFRPVKRWKAWGRLDFESQFCHKVAERPHTSLFMIFLFYSVRTDNTCCTTVKWDKTNKAPDMWSGDLYDSSLTALLFPLLLTHCQLLKDKDYLIHSCLPRTSHGLCHTLEGLQKCCRQSLNHFTKTLGARCFPEINFPIQNINMMYKLQLHVELPPTKSQVY